MDIEQLRQHWDRFGSMDPLWAVLSDPAKRHGRWSVVEFFESGRTEVDRVMTKIRAALAPDSRLDRGGKALDFGCGVGRATQALCQHFDECHGVDIARSMIEKARGYNSFPDRCHYRVIDREDLADFASSSFDFVYTAHVLQHMEPRYAHGYLAEFLRILKPGGVAMFELTTDRVIGATGPLPDDAFRATLTSVQAPSRLAPGGQAVVEVDVHNDSQHVWPATGHQGWYLVTLGNHWRTATGERVVNDDARTPLPDDLEPGSCRHLELLVTAPSEADRYDLELDLVQEGVAWFGDRGSEVVSTPVQVSTPSRISRLLRRRLARTLVTPVDVGGARMEMHGTPEATVAEWIEGAHGRLLTVFDWDEISRSRSYDWQRRGFVVVKP
jgi:SAM-dependent methyltransferase